MNEKVGGFLEVGIDEGSAEVVINHPDLKADENGVGHIIFSPKQARDLAQLLLTKAGDAERLAREREEARRVASLPPVDWSARTLADGSPVTEDHREINPATGQQKDYVVLSDEERKKGFVRPVRRSYKHLKCGTVTTMGYAIAETYAREPQFYSGTFCCQCRSHFPVGAEGEFVWVDDGTKVGT